MQALIDGRLLTERDLERYRGGDGNSTVENAANTGGEAAGAAIGTVIGGPVGAAVGTVLGAVFGPLFEGYGQEMASRDFSDQGNWVYW